MHSFNRIGVVVALAAAWASSPGAAGSGAVLAVPDRASANVSIAASGRFAAIVWAASGSGTTDVFSAVSHDGGRSFAAPVRVNQTAGDASAGGEQPPRVALTPGKGIPGIVVVWGAKGSSGTRLLSARSKDGGASFFDERPVPGSDAAGNRGWESIAAKPNGEVVALWLDHRALASGKSAPMTHAEHMHEATGQKMDAVARAQLSKLYFSRLDAAATAQALTGGVCYCCKTTIATGRDGAVYAAWRHVYPGNIRDIAFTMSKDGRTFAAPVRVSDDKWAIDGCPENGPALAVDADNRIHVVWPTLVPPAAASGEPTLSLFYAVSTDGRRFTPRQPIPTEGVPRHPQLALAENGDIVVGWDEQASGTRRVVIARARPADGGTIRFVRETIDSAQRADYPVVAAADGGLVLAWTSGSGQTVIRTMRIGN